MPPPNPFDEFDGIDRILTLSDLDPAKPGKPVSVLYPEPTPDPVALATGPTRTERVRTPDMNAVGRMVAAGRSAATVRAFLRLRGIDPGTVRNLNAAVRFRHDHPEAHSDAYVERQVPQKSWTRFVASPPGAAIVGALSGTSAGLLDEGTGAIDALINGRSVRDAIADQDARKQGLFRANPKSYLAGNMVGSLLAGAKVGTLTDSLIERAGLAGGRAKAASYLGDAAVGAMGGAGDSNDDRIGGAMLGAALAPAGRYLGEAAAIPAGAIARSSTGAAAIDATRRVFGATPIARSAQLRPEADADAIMTLNGQLLPREYVERSRPTRSFGLFGGAAAGLAVPYVQPGLPE